MVEQETGEPINILLVEDNPGDVRLTQEAFKDGRITNELHVVMDGEESLDFLYRRGDYAEAPRPHLILLDLNLPGIDGLEVLEEIKEDPRLQCIPVIILTGSEAEKDIVKSHESHSNAYLTKPVDPDELLDLVRSFEGFWLTLIRFPSAQD